MTTARSEDDDDGDGDHVQKVNEAEVLEQNHRNKSCRYLKIMITKNIFNVQGQGQRSKLLFLQNRRVREQP